MTSAALTLDDAPYSPSIPQIKQVSRFGLYIAQRGRCYLCGGSLGAYATIDHVIPQALGGRNVANILLAHQLCNAKKADRAPTEAETEWLRSINLILYGKSQ